MHYRIKSPKAFHENVTGLTHVFQSFTDEETVVGQTLTHANLLHMCLVYPSCLTLCDLLDCSPPGSSAHGIFQARVLEWVAISSPRGSS